jgi:cytochrome c-type biogenesis protein CcmF
MTSLTTTIGQYGLSAAVLCAACTLLVSFAAVRFGSQGLYRTVRRGSAALAILLTISSICLAIAMVQSDFSLLYVVKHSERALPFGYKLAAFWAGQEGSLLLWGWILAVMGLCFAYIGPKEDSTQRVAALATVALVVGFFAALMLFAANPFAANPEAIGLPSAEMAEIDGHGLNPMLQNPGMIAHPPLLFMGYAGYTIPFALLLGTLFAGKSDGKWLQLARPWILISWIFLTAGILLGAQWAYVELGWGGYWAWDPVENASLLPWLTGTALMHSIIAQRTQGIFKRWTASLSAITFILCIFGTWITRSGVVDSVHGFGKSMVGTFFGVFLVLSGLVSVVMVVVRWNRLRPDRPMEAIVSREGAILAGNILLVAMTLVTLFGTMYPAITSITSSSQSVNQSFYNHAVLPMAMILVGIMALSPLLTFGNAALERLMKNVAVPLAAAAVAMGVLWVLKVRSIWALAAAAAGAVFIASIAVDLFHATRARAEHNHEGWMTAVLGLLGSNHRKYGSHIVHVGVIAIVAGVVGSSLYGSKATLPLKVGESTEVGRYHLTLIALENVTGENYQAKEAQVEMTDTSSGRVTVLTPQYREYHKSENPSAEVAIRSSWREDLYVTLAGFEPGIATLQVIVNPLVSWIWAGGIILGLGAIVCLLPKFQPVPAPVASVIPACEAARLPKKKLRRERATANV